jgi:CBS domain-containing protein
MTQPNGTVSVGEVMSNGVIDAAPQTPLLAVAAQMAERGVHCVVVDGLARGRGGSEELAWGIVSDRDLISAAAAGRLGASAGEVAATEIVTISPSEPIEQAVRLMAQHECTHLIVVSDDGEPVGVIASLDVAAALAKTGTVS